MEPLNVKIDLLATEALVRIRSCLDLITEAGYVDSNLSLKERYFKILGAYNLNRTEQKMWEMVWNNQIVSLFQMEQDSGIKGIKLIKPSSLEELAVLNSVIRLMAPEKGGEQPLDMWARYRKDITECYKEMIEYGLDDESIEFLKNHSAITDGIAESQESLMILLQEPRLGGNSLAFADKARKALAKKIGKLFDECEKEYYENAKAKNCNEVLVNYVWQKLLRIQRGYSFK